MVRKLLKAIGWAILAIAGALFLWGCMWAVPTSTSQEAAEFYAAYMESGAK